tara:strand:- start:514 stop:1437 length:924 start_codon:yes stop_codon:yes gene_type:complete
MSHTGIPPLDQSETKVVFGELLASGEANFFDFRQHTSSDWDGVTPSGDDVFFSESGYWRTTNPNYLVKNPIYSRRHKEFLLTVGEESGDDEDVNLNKYIVASGINYPFPYPYNRSYPVNVYSEIFSIAWWEASGVFKTYPEAAFLVIDRSAKSGILHWDGLRQVEDFSNSPNVAPLVPEVTFNKYIHYLPEYPYHKHMISPESSLEPPDYSNPSINLEGLRRQQKRKYIEVEYLTDVKKRQKTQYNSGYSLDERDLFPSTPSNAADAVGSCTFPDGRCIDGYTQQACTAYPGAIWSEEICEQEDLNE